MTNVPASMARTVGRAITSMSPGRRTVVLLTPMGVAAVVMIAVGATSAAQTFGHGNDAGILGVQRVGHPSTQAPPGQQQPEQQGVTGTTQTIPAPVQPNGGSLAGSPVYRTVGTPANGLSSCSLRVAGVGAVGCDYFKTPKNFSDPTLLPPYTPNSPSPAYLSMVTDSSGTIYVTMPQGTNASPGVALFSSTDGGRSFQTLPTPANAGSQDQGFSGTAADAAVDSNGSLFVASSWTTSISSAVSTDHGQTWTGIPVAHAVPQNNGLRIWLAYDSSSDALYMLWFESDGIHVGRALLHDQLRGTAAASTEAIAFSQDVLVVPSLPGVSTGAQNLSPSSKQPGYAGPLTVDQQGDVWFAYGQNTNDGSGSIGIAKSAPGGLQWTVTSIPGSGAGGGSTILHGWPVVQADDLGNMYASWTEAADPDGLDPKMYYSYLRAGDSAWHIPILVSKTAVALMGTLAVVAPGVVDVVYYGTDTGTRVDPKSALGTYDTVFFGTWNLYAAQSTDALGAGHFRTDIAAKFVDNALCVGLALTCLAGLGDTLGQPVLTVDPRGSMQIAAVINDFATLTCPKTSGKCSGAQHGAAYIHQVGPLVGDQGTTAGATNVLPGAAAAKQSLPTTYSFPKGAGAVQRVEVPVGQATQQGSGTAARTAHTLPRTTLADGSAVPAHTDEFSGGSARLPALLALLVVAGMGTLMIVGRLVSS